MLRLSLTQPWLIRSCLGSSFTMQFSVRKPTPCFLAYLYTYQEAEITPLEIPIYYREILHCLCFSESQSSAAFQTHVVLLKTQFQIPSPHVINLNFLKESKASESSRSYPSFPIPSQDSCLLSDILPAMSAYGNSPQQSAMCFLTNSYSMFD